MPNVSVVIPTYNRARWLPETVASVLNQTCPPLEVLIVDDGSTDDTEAVCARFPEPVRYLRQDNAGVSAARNRGVQHARGEWIGFVDSDDVWEANKLAVQLAALRALPNARWCITDCVVIDPDGQRAPPPQGFEAVFPVFGELRITPDELFTEYLAKGRFQLEGADYVLYAGDAFPLLFNGNVGLPSSVLIHRSVADTVGGFDEQFRLAEDTEYVHRVAATFPVAIVMSPLVRYRVGHQSLISPTNVPQLARNALKSLDQATRLRSRLSDAERRAFESGRRHLYFKLAYSHLSQYEPTAARGAVAMAWRAGALGGPRILGVYAASFLPAGVLRGLHACKRWWRRWRT